jgi:phosphoribosylamine--glycine ligase
VVTRAAGARKARQKKEAVCNRVDQSCRCIDAGAFGCAVQPDFVKVDFDLPRYPVLLSFKSVKVLVIGGGGREHALVWRLKQSPSVSRVFAAPGNPGIAKIAQCILSTDYLRIAEEFDIDLTVVGPEAPLVAGVVDAFRAAGRKIIGPTQVNAQLEGSKVFAKNFFAKYNIPTAAFHTVTTREDGLRALDSFTYPVVVKADGLAAGKGVTIAYNRAEASAAVDALGPYLVIEEFMEGEEVSFIVLSDGRNVLPFAPCQDHKTVFDGDTGPNTGGMGAYSDSRILTAPQQDAILNRIIQPTIDATGFTGFLFAGLMMTAEGPKLLEFNVRLGDPETQPLMHRMVADFDQVLLASVEGRLDGMSFDWRPDPSVCVVLASGGYPAAFQSGQPILGIGEAEATGATVFQAGTRTGLTGPETAGGRVLGVTARGSGLPQAIENAYLAVDKISFEGMHYRRDIGRKGLRRYNGNTGT